MSQVTAMQHPRDRALAGQRLCHMGAVGLFLLLAACAGGRDGTTGNDATERSAGDERGAAADQQIYRDNGHWHIAGVANPTPVDAEYKVGAPYSVDGVVYEPSVNYSYDQTGIASWYGPNFHGQETANGEIFDMNAVTAAHPTLPIPSIVRVDNLENGRSLTLRINDRGPYAKGRIIDLSRRSAELLGVRGNGVARVRVRVLEEPSRALAARLGEDAPPAQDGLAVARSVLEPDAGTDNGAAATTGNDSTTPVETAAASTATTGGASGETELFIQVGAYLDRENALATARELDAVAEPRIEQAEVDGRRFHRVRLGPMDAVERADAILSQVIELGHRDARIVVDW